MITEDYVSFETAKLYSEKDIDTITELSVLYEDLKKLMEE